LSIEAFHQNKKNNFKIIVLQINAPALDYLYFKGYLDEDVLFETLSNLVHTVLGVDFDLFLFNDIIDYENKVREFIKALYNIKPQHFFSDTTEVNYFFMVFY
jgi:hypothetical protein